MKLEYTSFTSDNLEVSLGSLMTVGSIPGTVLSLAKLTRVLVRHRHKTQVV